MRVAERPRVDYGDVMDLNAQAFGELRGSIADGGEDFVQRMRNWEAERLQASVPISAGSIAGTESPMQLDDEDEEDVEIISSGPSSDDSSTHLPHTAPHICSSLFAPASDVIEMQDADMIPRPYKHIVGSSMRTRRNSLAAICNIPEPKAQSEPRRAYHEDRAIDALSLAMSTGAGGIRDYSVVRDVLGAERSAEAEAEVGGMWD